MAGAGLIPDILEQHLEEVQFLWGQRQAALRSPDYSLRALAELEARIEAHVQGLLLGEEAMALVEPGLAAEEPLPSFAAAYALLRMGSEAARRRVDDAFRQAKGGQLEGITQALCHAPASAVPAPLPTLVASAPAPLGLAAAEVLVFHGKLDRSEAVERCLRHEDAQVRRAAWRIVGRGEPRPPEVYQAGAQDKDPEVRREALTAAAWGRPQWLVDHGRTLAGKASPDHGDMLTLLAVLAKPNDLPLILTIGRAPTLGPKRFAVLGAFGHPDVVEALIEGMQSNDPRTAVAAGAAFTKITGREVPSDKRVTLPPEDGSEPDEFEKEFLDEARLPSPELAREHWNKVKSHFSKGTRWGRGFDLSAAAGKEGLPELDRESHWEACVRGKFEGTWKGRAVDLELFPQGRG